MPMSFFRIGRKILGLNHVESGEPCDDYGSPDIKVIMRSSKKRILTHGSQEERDRAVEKLREKLSGLSGSRQS